MKDFDTNFRPIVVQISNDSGYREVDAADKVMAERQSEEAKATAESSFLSELTDPPMALAETRGARGRYAVNAVQRILSEERIDSDRHSRNSGRPARRIHRVSGSFRTAKRRTRRWHGVCPKLACTPSAFRSRRRCLPTTRTVRQSAECDTSRPSRPPRPARRSKPHARSRPASGGPAGGSLGDQGFQHGVLVASPCFILPLPSVGGSHFVDVTIPLT